MLALCGPLLIDEDSLPPASDLPLVSPFLCSDDSEADGESEPAKQRPVSSSHYTLALLSEFPLAPVVAPPWIRRRAKLIFVRPTYNGDVYLNHSIGSSIFTRLISSSSSSSRSFLFRHTPPDTTDADSSTPQRFVHRSLARTPRRSEAFRRWRSAPLSTPYPPTTLESSKVHLLREDSGEEHMKVDIADAEAVADVESAQHDRDRSISIGYLVDSSESSRRGLSLLPLMFHLSLSELDPIFYTEVGAVPVVSPTRVLDLVDYSSSSDSDPSEDSLPPVPDLPLVSPFLCSDDSVSPPFAPVVAPPWIRDGQRFLSHPVRLFPSVDLITPTSMGRRRVSHHSSDHHSSPDSSSSSSSSDHSLSEHTPPMLIHLHNRDLFIDHLLGLHDIVRLLDVRDSSSHSSRLSHKRCRSPAASVPSPTYVSRSIAPTPADLLPPRKRFKDSYLPEDSGEEHIEVDTSDAEAVADVAISDGVVAHHEDGVGMGFKIAASDVREDDEEFEAEASAADMREIVVDPLAIRDSYESSRGGILDLEDTIYDIVHYMSEVHIDRITKIETTQRQLV
ncbi:hypothetical protein Tco_0998284 [Tanacetum coccineum]